MARPRAKSESPVSYGRTAPVVTDRINQLQVAVSNHKNRGKSLYGGEPIVLPKSSTTNRQVRERAQPLNAYDNTELANLKWRHINEWKVDTDEAGTTTIPLHRQDENNIPFFDPFQLGPVSTTAEDIDKKIDAYLQKVAKFDKKRRSSRENNSKEPLSPRLRSPLTRCFSPNKNNRRGRSVSFDLFESQEDIRQLHDEKRERRARLYDKKVYVSKRNRRASVSIPAFDANNQVGNSSPPALESASTEEIDDFFDLLVAKASSSSSNGATEWFENLLDEAREPTESCIKSNRPHPIEPPDLLLSERETIHPKEFSASLQPDSPIKANEHFGENGPVNIDISWVKEDSWPDQDPPPAPSSAVNGSARKSMDCRQMSPSRIDKQGKKQSTKPKLFVLETVRSVDSDESGASACEQQVDSLRTSPVSGSNSPNWRSNGRSRTDHLLRSIGSGQGRKKGVYDAFGMRRDPEARRYNSGQKDPDGILGNQLTESSSEESRDTGPRSSSLTESTTDGTDQSENSKLVPIIDYQVTAQHGPEIQSSLKDYVNRPSLIDVDISKSTSASTKSSEQTGPKQVLRDVSGTSLSATRIDPEAKTRKKMTQSDEESSIFSDLPSGSLAQSAQMPDSASCVCLPDERMADKMRQKHQKLEECTLLSTLASDAALFQGRPSQKTTARAQPTTTLRPASRPDDSGRTSMLFDSDLVPGLSPSELRGSGHDSPPSGFDSPGKVRSYWKTLASLKTLGSFDSESMVKLSSGRRVPPRPQSFIDRYPHVANRDDDPILPLRSPATKEVVHRLGVNQMNQTHQPPEKSKSMPRQSNARYLCHAPIPADSRAQADDVEERRIRQSDIWMTSMPEQKVTASEKGPELSKPVEESVMYLMGPLMSGDTEEVSVVTDDFTGFVDDNASVAAQQSCYNHCGGLVFSGWSWFS